MTYREDESRIPPTRERENFAWRNRIRLSLFKQHKNQKNMARNRRRCGWNENVLLEILTRTTTERAPALAFTPPFGQGGREEWTFSDVPILIARSIPCRTIQRKRPAAGRRRRG